MCVWSEGAVAKHTGYEYHQQPALWRTAVEVAKSYSAVHEKKKGPILMVF